MHRGGCLELYYCNMVEWSWCDSSLIWTTSWFPSVLWHCWFGHMTCKIIADMTCNVFGGTLNLAQSINYICCVTVKRDPVVSLQDICYTFALHIFPSGCHHLNVKNVLMISVSGRVRNRSTSFFSHIWVVVPPPLLGGGVPHPVKCTHARTCLLTEC